MPDAMRNLCFSMSIEPSYIETVNFEAYLQHEGLCMPQHSQ